LQSNSNEWGERRSRIIESLASCSPTRLWVAACLADDHTEDILARNGAVNAAVSRVHAVVAEEKELVFAARDELFLDFAAGVGRRAVREIGFLQFCAVDVNRAVFKNNGIATDADDAFDRKAFGGGIANDNDVLAGRGRR